LTVLVDTPIWSTAYRRAKPTAHDERVLDEWRKLVRRQDAMLIGPVRQEVLSGFARTARFELLRTTLRAFVDVPLVIDDFERAADLCNHCRSKGVQGSPTDYLICAVSLRYGAAVFTTDRDFEQDAKHIGIHLHKPRA
jgi:predicted nucleic acid-binding protein